LHFEIENVMGIEDVEDGAFEVKILVVVVVGFGGLMQPLRMLNPCEGS